MKDYILAHDLGTTGNKATLYDKEGKLVGSAFSGYETVYAHAGWAEQDPADWWRAVCESTRQLINESGIDGTSVGCITFSGQMMGCVPLDANAMPLRRAIIWADTRAVEQVEQVRRAFGRTRFWARLRLMLHSCPIFCPRQQLWVGCCLRWLKKLVCVVGSGSTYSYVGSSAWIAIAADKPIYDPEERTFTFAHVLPNMYMPVGTMQAAGASYQWIRNELCTTETEQATDNGENVYDLMNKLAATVPAGSDGLIYLPYLMGERAPRWNPDARGAFIGLTIRHTRSHMIRATLEGVTLNLNVILDALRRQGARVDAMRLIGGGAQGQLWNQIMADVYGVPIQRLAILEEATSMGAAVVGGVGVGLYTDFSIAEQMNEVVSVTQPNQESHAIYEQVKPLFDESYDALVPLFDKLKG